MFTKRERAVIWAIFADGHPNSKVGLFHPDGFIDDEGGTYLPSKAQHWLWRKWSEYWAFVAALKKQHRADVWAVSVGDGCDDNSHDKHGLITPNKAGIVSIAKATWEPALEVADLSFVVRGTRAHVGGAGELEELLAKEIDAVPDEQVESKPHSWWWLPLEAHGVVGDFAHRPGSNSRLPWTVGGGANRQAAIIIHDRAESGDPLPRYGFRAHVHHLEDSGENHPVRVLFCPPWQLRTEFGTQIGYAGRIERVGGLVVVVQPDGESQVIVKRFKAKRRPPWTRSTK